MNYSTTSNDFYNFCKANEVHKRLVAPFVTKISDKLWTRYANQFINKAYELLKELFGGLNLQDYIHAMQTLLLLENYPGSSIADGSAQTLIRLSNFDENISQAELAKGFWTQLVNEKLVKDDNYIFRPLTDHDIAPHYIIGELPLKLKSKTRELYIDKTIKDLILHSTGEVLEQWVTFRSVTDEELNETCFFNRTMPENAGEILWLVYRIRNRVIDEMTHFYALQIILDGKPQQENTRPSKESKPAQTVKTSAEVKQSKEKDMEIERLRTEMEKLNQKLQHYENQAAKKESATTISQPQPHCPTRHTVKDQDAEKDYIDYSYRYLFPMNEHMNVEPGIRKLFPNARIIYNATSELPKGTQLVVHITDIQSHALYNKFKDRTSYDIVHVPHANINLIKTCLNDYFKKKRKEGAVEENN